MIPITGTRQATSVPKTTLPRLASPYQLSPEGIPHPSQQVVKLLITTQGWYRSFSATHCRTRKAIPSGKFFASFSPISDGTLRSTVLMVFGSMGSLPCFIYTGRFVLCVCVSVAGPCDCLLTTFTLAGVSGLGLVVATTSTSTWVWTWMLWCT